MATRFEFVLHGEDPARLRAAGEEALDEIERVERLLSYYRGDSEVNHLNQRAGLEAVRVTPELFRLLRQAKTLSLETDGAFDLTVAPLLRAWGFTSGSGGLPNAKELADAWACVGMNKVELDEANLTVRFKLPGVKLDFGAFGKGYALERAAELLRAAGVTCALLHGGTSTVCALGSPSGEDFWKIALAHPSEQQTSNPSNPFAVVPLRDESLSVSAVWGKSFTADGRTYGHVIDPRTGEPAQGAVLAAVVLPSAAETDALSTALLTLGLDGHNRITTLRPGMKSLVIALTSEAGRLEIRAKGIESRPANLI